MKDDNEVKICSRCKQEKVIDDFRAMPRMTKNGIKVYRNSHCLLCEKVYSADHYLRTKSRRQELHKEWRDDNKDKLRGYRLKADYGLTVEQYQEMYDAQEGLCSICGDHHDTLCVDHSHETGKVRGLLCSSCNIALGKLKDDAVIVQRAADYLLEHTC